ncbi:MAG: DNA-binding response regulator [Chloroflexi bacterium]|nr:MAG: DNA-binding response regulator [Chloroflexota bacterium]
MPVRVLITDDHGVLREGVISILDDYSEFIVVGEAEDGKKAIELAERLRPDVIILDLMLPILDGFQVARRLRRTRPDIKILVLSALTELEVVNQAKMIGVDAYVSKARCVEDLVDALHFVVQGKRFISPGLNRYAPVVKPSGVDRDRKMSRLTSRERQVMSMIAAGLTNKQIAQRLGISIHTVRSHRQRLMSKLDVHDIATLTRIAVNWGVLNQ